MFSRGSPIFERVIIIFHRKIFCVLNRIIILNDLKKNVTFVTGVTN